MRPSDRRDVDQLKRLFKPPRPQPMFGNGPETVRRIMDSMTVDSSKDGHQSVHDATDIFTDKEGS